jgi:hypothetical protein
MGIAAGGSAPRERPLPDYPSPPTAPDASRGAALARMVDRIIASRPRSGADALRELRAAFPDSPLTLRVAALDLLMRRQGHAMSYSAMSYSPR